MPNNNNHPDAEVDISTLRKVIAASAIGNFVEWFDFAVYGFLAVVIANHFFPPGDPSLALLQTFAVFAVSFALRPLGGVFFGMLGDRIGRKRVLAMTVMLMAGATTLIGLLPTYSSIGLLAPLALALARCIQGFSAGGEYAGACAFVMEHAPRRRKARYGSFVPVSTFAAFATAAALTYAVGTVDMIAEEAAQSGAVERAADLVLGAVGGDAARQPAQRIEGTGGALDRREFGSHALVHLAAHVALRLFAQRGVDLAIGAFEMRHDAGETCAAKVVHVIEGAKGKACLGEVLGHDLGQQRFAVDQGAVAIEEQAERVGHDGSPRGRCQ